MATKSPFLKGANPQTPDQLIKKGANITPTEKKNEISINLFIYSITNF
jgi:hypothetical protein